MTPSNLKSARKSLGLSQRRLAEALGYTGKHANRDIRRMEAGSIPIPQRVEEGVAVLLRGAESVKVKTVLVFEGEELVLDNKG